MAVIGFILLSFLCSEAFAHKVSIFAWSEEGFVVGKTGFSVGPPPKLAEIIVEDKETGAILLTTRTDKEGKFSFKPPANALENRLTLRLIVKAGPGHQGEWLLPPEDYISMDSKPVYPVEITSPSVVTSQEQGDYSSHIDVAVVQKIVEDALDEKLAPVKRMLVEAQDKGPQLSEVVAGVGYIFGLFGLLAYWKSRKKVSGE